MAEFDVLLTIRFRGVALAHMGECKVKRAAENVCICPFNYEPMCGKDGNTYGNTCAMKCRYGLNPKYLVSFPHQHMLEKNSNPMVELCSLYKGYILNGEVTLLTTRMQTVI